jgi:mediator of RNA polymerase II transcription subunit 16, fungi type
VKLIYQMDRWNEAVVELESIGSSKDLLTHASFASDSGMSTGTPFGATHANQPIDDSVLLAVHTASREVRLYRIVVNWNIEKASNKTSTQLPSQASMTANRVQIVDLCYSTPPTSPDNIAFPNVGQDDINKAKLTHLELISPLPQKERGEFTYPTIMTISSYMPDHSDIAQQPFSVISRWELRSATYKLDPVFGQLSKKSFQSSAKLVRSSAPLVKTSADPCVLQNGLELIKMEDVVTPKIILSVQQINSGKEIVLTYSDGAVEFRDKTTMIPIVPNGDVKTVTSMSQVGFSYPTEEPCEYFNHFHTFAQIFTDVEPALHHTLSSNQCLAVSLNSDHDFKVRRMQYGKELLDNEGKATRKSKSALKKSPLNVISCFHCSRQRIGSTIRAFLYAPCQ